MKVQYEPEVGRSRPGSRPERLELGEARWHRFPNANGGGVSVHPDETAELVRDGIPFEGRRGIVYYVERHAYVDVLHFHFVTAAEAMARPA